MNRHVPRPSRLSIVHRALARLPLGGPSGVACGSAGIACIVGIVFVGHGLGIPLPGMRDRDRDLTPIQVAVEDARPETSLHEPIVRTVSTRGDGTSGTKAKHSSKPAPSGTTPRPGGSTPQRPAKTDDPVEPTPSIGVDDPGGDGDDADRSGRDEAGDGDGSRDEGGDDLEDQSRHDDDRDRIAGSDEDRGGSSYDGDDATAVR